MRMGNGYRRARVGPADVAARLQQIETEWGVRVTVSLHPVQYGAAPCTAFLRAFLPEPTHRAELHNPPECCRILREGTTINPWAEALALLWDWEVLLEKHLTYPPGPPAARRQ